MRVKELIRLLQKCDPEATVITEGCDCFGTPWDVITLEEYHSKGSYADMYEGVLDIIITREGGH